MNNDRKIFIDGKACALSGLAVVAAIGANVLMFCILAMARTMPSPTYPQEYVYRGIITLDMPVPTSAAPAGRETVMDVIQLSAQATDTELPQPAAEMASSTFPRLDERIRNLSLNFPGLPIRPSNVSLLSPASAAAAGIVDKPASVPDIDRLPSKIAGLLPRYPQWALRDKLEATVILRFIVTAEGAVEDIKINEIQGDERFGEEATRAVGQWHFSPAIKAGKAIPCWCFQKINFKFTP